MLTFVQSTNKTHRTMKKKKILFLSVTLFASTLYGQVVGVKTNVVMDALKIINVGAEVGLSKKLTLDLYANYNPWEYKNQKMMKMFAFQPELRYWFCDKFNGHFVGLHLHGGVYQAAAIDMPGDIWPELKEHRFKGNFYGLGISYGYQWILGKHWNLEGNIGIGYVRAKYEEFECKTCGEKIDEGHKNYVGPTKAAVSLIYLF